jgi:RNA polymerase sigma-70 factor (ECF subfamily)
METEIQNRIDPARWAGAYSKYLFSFSMNRLKDKQKAEDMVQDTFLKALKKINQFKGTCSERTWLTAILKNNIYDLLRRESKISRLEDTDAAIENEDEYFDENGQWKKGSRPGFWQADKLDSLEKKELFIVFDKCINNMPAQWASVFNRKHLEDEKSENICKELNITPSNLWTIMHRAKLMLRGCMERFWFRRIN